MFTVTCTLYAHLSAGGFSMCFNLFLTANANAFCGNSVVEEGEECDCGLTADCLRGTDKCCNVYVADPKSNPAGGNCKINSSMGACRYETL